MEALKTVFIYPSILALPYSSGHMTSYSDACNVQIGYILQQKQPDDTTKPVGSCSRFLMDAEKRYDTAQRKWRAIVWAVLLLRPYLKRPLLHHLYRPWYTEMDL